MAAGWSNSTVASATYRFTAATPAFSPIGGTYAKPLTVAISDASPGATIYYTTNGTTPTTSSKPYTGPITLTNNATVKALAVVPGWTNSSVGSVRYSLQ